jgi:CRP-like cAMP-binding protein
MRPGLGTAEFDILRSSAMFAGLSPAMAQEVLAGAKIEVHEAETTLFHQGDPSQAFFMVLSGWVKLGRVLPNGVESVIGVFTRGQSFGEAIAIAGADYPVTATTVTGVRLIRVPVASLKRVIAGNPDVALAMVASTAQHLHLLVQQIEQLKARKGPERVVEFLLSLTDVDTGAAAIDLPFDKTLIAGRLGMQPESLSRAFSRLRGFGVKVNGARVEIADVARLRVNLLDDDEDGATTCATPE